MVEDCTRLAIYGLGGCGKTALALELAYRIREQEPARSILWVPALSQKSFEQAYQKIGEFLRILGIEDNKSNVKIKQFVEETLSNEEEAGKWFIIVDNADA
jgi:NH3-dependent NAD+ synthetase